MENVGWGSWGDKYRVREMRVPSFGFFCPRTQVVCARAFLGCLLPAPLAELGGGGAERESWQLSGCSVLSLGAACYGGC
jgi:hypothetical protein